MNIKNLFIINKKRSRASTIPDFKYNIPPPPKPNKLQIDHVCFTNDNLTNIVVRCFGNRYRLEYYSSDNTDGNAGYTGTIIGTLYTKNTIFGVWRKRQH